MTQLLAHPFRLAGDAFATVDDDSDDGVSQEIALLCTTRVGERPMAPGYGIPDPAFGALDENDISAGVQLFGPPGIQVDSLAVTVDHTGQTATAVVTYSHTTT